MREVRTCDFCGDDATGLYEPLPASIPEGPRMLLCGDCRDRLATVVDPLLDRIDADVDSPSAGRSASESSGGPTERGSRARPSRRTGARTGTDASEPGRRREPSPPVDSAPSGESPDTTEPASTDAPPGGVEVSESRDASGRPQRERAGTPHGYRKVMRFLENRSFPIEREEAERLVVEAYDLDQAAVAKAIDHAVQYGRLREVSGELKR